MVNAAALEEYEIWFLASSMVASAAVGFFVAFMQSFQRGSDGTQHSDGTYLVVGVVFGLLTALCIWRAILLRKRITSESKTYRMKASASASSATASHDPK